MTELTPRPAQYTEWLADLKAQIASAQLRSTLAVNAELIRLYWEIGRAILEKQEELGWVAKSSPPWHGIYGLLSRR